MAVFRLSQLFLAWNIHAHVHTHRSTQTMSINEHDDNATRFSHVQLKNKEPDITVPTPSSMPPPPPVWSIDFSGFIQAPAPQTTSTRMRLRHFKSITWGF